MILIGRLTMNPDMLTTPSDNSEVNYIKLDQFLKYMNAVPSGGQAKVLIQSGEVMVNQRMETRRGRKLVHGDRVTLYDQTYLVDTVGEPD
jgi:ribosome-associated protein